MKLRDVALFNALWVWALLPEEIEHTKYGSDVDYGKAVAGHIEKMLGIQEQVLEKNAASIEKSSKNLIKVCQENRPLLVCCGRCCAYECKTTTQKFEERGCTLDRTMHYSVQASL